MLRFKCIAKVVRAVNTPAGATVPHHRTLNVPQKVRRSIVLFQPTWPIDWVVRAGGTVIKHPTRILCPPINLDRAVFEKDIFDWHLGVSIDSETVLCNSSHLLEPDIAQRAGFPICGSRPDRDGCSLAPAPPAGGVVLRKKFDIAKLNILDVAGLAMSDRGSATSGDDAAALEENLRYIATRLRCDLDPAVPADNRAIAHRDVV